MDDCVKPLLVISSSHVDRHTPFFAGKPAKIVNILPCTARSLKRIEWGYRPRAPAYGSARRTACMIWWDLRRSPFGRPSVGCRKDNGAREKPERGVAPHPKIQQSHPHHRITASMLDQNRPRASSDKGTSDAMSLAMRRPSSSEIRSPGRSRSSIVQEL